MSAREQKRTAAFIYERRTFMIRISVESPSPAFLAGEGDSVKNKHMNTEKATGLRDLAALKRS